MARGSDTAKSAATSGLNFSNTQQGNSQGIFNTLAPQLQAEAAHPAGMSPEDLAAANTSVQQSAGGGQAGAVGQGALLAGRTRNAGTADAAIAESARTAGRNLSEGALQTQLKNATLKEGQRRAALGEQAGLYGTSVGGANSALGQSAANTNADVNAQNASWNWAKYILDPALQAAGSAAGGGAFGAL